jgi:hypothetical protein
MAQIGVPELIVWSLSGPVGIREWALNAAGIPVCMAEEFTVSEK